MAQQKNPYPKGQTRPRQFAPIETGFMPEPPCMCAVAGWARSAAVATGRVNAKRVEPVQSVQEQRPGIWPVGLPRTDFRLSLKIPQRSASTEGEKSPKPSSQDEPFRA